MKALPFFALLCCAMVQAQTAPHEPPAVDQVVVTSHRPDPEKISYDKVLEAMALFDKDHARAPGSVLEFRLIPRHKFDMSALHLTIRSGDEKIPVPLNAELVFNVPVIDRLRDHDAYLVLNKNSDNFRWRAYVHLPDQGQDSIRLGDLRESCRITYKAGLASAYGPGAALSSLYDDACLSAPSVNSANYYTFRPLFGVTMTDATRREEMETKNLWRSGQQDELALIFVTNYERMFSYEPPTRDKTWSDATVLTFTYMDDSDATQQTP